MPRSVEIAGKPVSVVSSSIPDEEISEMLSTPATQFHGHFIYPADYEGRKGNHLDALFIIEPIAAVPRFVDWIAGDIERWIKAEDLRFDLILAPAQPAVQQIVTRLAERTGARKAFWQYLPGGWFGDHLVEGEVTPGDRVLVFNGVTQQGRCVGERLPGFVQELGGTTVGAAVFAKGTAPGVIQAEEKYGPRFYSTIQVPIEIATPEACRLCASGQSQPVPWTAMRDG